MGKRAVRLLASLVLAGALAACVPPAPLRVVGALPPPTTTYIVVGEDDLGVGVRETLVRALAVHSLTPALSDMKPDRLNAVTLADRPRMSGGRSRARRSPPRRRLKTGSTARPEAAPRVGARSG